MTFLPNAPDTKDPRAVADWMNVTKGRLEQAPSIAYGIPIRAPMVGDMAYKSPLAWARLALGMVGQILTVGTGTAPTWGNISSNISAGTGISVTGTSTAIINTSLSAGSNISITGTATQTIALSTALSGIIYFGTNAVAEENAFSNGNSGTSKALNLDNGNLQTITITGTVAITQTTPTHPGKYTVIVTQDGTGHSYSYTGIKWSGGAQPAWSTSASAVDIASILYNGTNFYGVGNVGFS